MLNVSIFKFLLFNHRALQYSGNLAISYDSTVTTLKNLQSHARELDSLNHLMLEAALRLKILEVNH